MTSTRVRITGVVQGVGFRWFTRAHAEARGVSGWVRNRRDGSVEAELHGAAEDVEAVLRLLRTGPPNAAVSRIDSEDLPPSDSPPTGFEIRASE
ncbi:acylphosphatase [Microbacterium hydrocarbonoxydans]|uniref:acylphosphatase n=1 Tax=Microbacterium hydrocarbonoxydans TaxID=273678 RepID=UPI0007BAE22F|nr:acylphosphatase [Microbacterium hydrocarbonoxydans]GAT73050.1 acylphosphatase [Microbacterium sp. HM58-2]